MGLHFFCRILLWTIFVLVKLLDSNTNLCLYLASTEQTAHNNSNNSGLVAT